MSNRSGLLWLFVMCAATVAQAQLNPVLERAQDVQLNSITTAVPFLLITPDSRSGAMGDAGVALSPDANSIHWNPAKMAFSEKDLEFGISYSPWLRSLVNDMNLGYVAGYKKLNKNQAVGAALRYFSLGQITFTDNSGTTIREFKPNEFSLDLAFSQRLSDNFAGGITGKFVYSNLTGSTNIQGADSKPGVSGAIDLGLFYSNDDLEIAKKDATLNFGLRLANIGAKMSYTTTSEQDFLPANLTLGSALTLDINEFNKITFAVDANKLLVPTPPVYDSDGEDILAGKDPNVGVATAIFQSFYDAPGSFTTNGAGDVIQESGSVFKEEMHEINVGGGIEYLYANQFAVRAGYFNEHSTKGNRKYITMGAGLKYQVIGIDLSYLVSTTQRNPLENTLRFSLTFDLEGGAGAPVE